MSVDDQYLSDWSEKDKPWDTHGAEAEIVKEIYRDTDFHRYFESISGCSKILQFGFVSGEKGELKFKLKLAYFCRVRHCPKCQWRRSLKLKKRFSNALTKIMQDYPTARFISLVLTVKNPPITELRSTLSSMNKAWTRMSQRKQFPAIGWVKSTEVTREKNTDYCHPHFHAVLMVPSGYFSTAGGYLSKDKWVELWKKSLRAEYDPSVYVKAVKPRDNQDMSAAVKETLKYAVKPEDMIVDPNWMLELTAQLHGTRAVAIGGVFKNYMSDDEPEDLIHIDEESNESASDNIVFFGWKQRSQRYVYRKDLNE